MRQKPGFYRQVAVLATPIILQNLITSALGMADIFMVGLLGETPMAAVTLVNIPTFVIQLFFFGVQSGGSVLIACQPTRGVDLGAAEFIHQKILDFRNAGNSVLLVSSELSEVMSLSDRVIVMYKGAIVGEVDPKVTSNTKMGLLMAGITDGE